MNWVRDQLTEANLDGFFPDTDFRYLLKIATLTDPYLIRIIFIYIVHYVSKFLIINVSSVVKHDPFGL